MEHTAQREGGVTTFLDLYHHLSQTLVAKTFQLKKTMSSTITHPTTQLQPKVRQLYTEDKTV